jgi:DNA-binding GntR family transcriptional regulator
MSDVTLILEAVQQGDAHAAEKLLPLVYHQLRQLAARKLAREKNSHTLQPTALVHEAGNGH